MDKIMNAAHEMLKLLKGDHPEDVEYFTYLFDKGIERMSSKDNPHHRERGRTFVMDAHHEPGVRPLLKRAPHKFESQMSLHSEDVLNPHVRQRPSIAMYNLGGVGCTVIDTVMEPMIVHQSHRKELIGLERFTCLEIRRKK